MLDGPRPTSPCAPMHGHAVQFYDDDSFLHRTVAEFVEAGLHDCQPVLVVASQTNRKAFAEQLAARGRSVTALQEAGQLTMLDARELLANLMTTALPHPELFRQHVGRLIDRCAGGRSDVTVRVYGEMVNLLWRDGNPEAALRLEELWNDLGTSHRFSLLCGYAMSQFSSETHGTSFQEICNQHERVLPTESYVMASDEGARLRQIAVLQQRARALETEIAHRGRLEGSLRQALADRDRAELDRERLLADERAARAEAESASRLKDEFLAVLSHELRTPLNAILGWTHIATEAASSEATIRRALDVIQRNARLQLHVTDDLLDVSSILTGKMVVASDALDLGDVLSSALDTVRSAATAKSIELQLSIDDGARQITGDRDRLQQILWNLLSNAIKFTPPGGRVELHLQRHRTLAQIVVKDTGQGIPPDFLPHVFERFRQAESGTTRLYGGLGLGLAVVRYLVEAHGGTARVESGGIGHGATFIVSLPLRGWPSALPRENAAPAAATLKNVRILVVDEDRDARELFGYVLGGAGAAVAAVSSSSEALGMLPGGRFDVLLGDIGLPGRDGYGLIGAIRAHPDPDVRSIRAIAVTSYGVDHHKSRAIGAGFDEYVTKPVDPPHLVRIISDLVLRRRRKH